MQYEALLDRYDPSLRPLDCKRDRYCSNPTTIIII
jgi:hypothetical protein